MVQHIKGNELQNLIATEEKTVVCDFWASWCGPCRMLAPVFEELSKKYDGQAVFVKVDIDEEENESVAIKYGISSIPNILAFKGGQAVDSHLGFAPAPVIEAFVKNCL